MHAKEYLYPSLYPGIFRIAICFRESYRARSFNTRSGTIGKPESISYLITIETSDFALPLCEGKGRTDSPSSLSLVRLEGQ